jgi:HEAT repeat protein
MTCPPTSGNARPHPRHLAAIGKAGHPMSSFVIRLSWLLLLLQLPGASLHAGIEAILFPKPSTTDAALVSARLQSSDQAVRRQALVDAELLGPAAAQVVPALQAMLSDDTLSSETHAWAARALGRMGVAAIPAIPALLNLLSNETPDDSSFAWTPAAAALCNLCSPMHRPASADLHQALLSHTVVKRLILTPHSDTNHCSYRTYWDELDGSITLQKLTNPESRHVAEVLLTAMHSGQANSSMLYLLCMLGPYHFRPSPCPDSGIDESTSTLMINRCDGRDGYFTPPAPDVIPYLASLLRDDRQKQLWPGVLFSLQALGPEAAPAVPELLRLMDDPLIHERDLDEVLWIFANVGPPAASAVPRVSDCLQNPYDVIRGRAVLALGEIGPAAATALPQLLKLAQSPDLSFDDAGPVFQALGKIAPHQPEVLDLLFAALADPHSAPKRYAAAECLSWLSRQDPLVVKRLITAVADPGIPDRPEAVLALCGAGPAAAPAIPLLKGLFHQQDVMLRYAAAEVLAFIGDAAIPALLQALKSSDVRARYHAAYSLGRIGPRQSEILPALIQVLHDEERAVRRSAIRALGDIGPAAASAVPSLLPLLADRNATIGALAAESLVQIGPQNPDVLQALNTALQPPHPAVRESTKYSPP